MTGPSMSVVDFLLARIAEDEASARSVIDCEYAQYKGRWREACSGVIDTGAPGIEWLIPTADSALSRFIVEQDPDRVLSEALAKRRIVTLHRGDHECSSYNTSIGEDDGCAWIVNGGCSTLYAIARVYSSHPDFDLEWSEPDTERSVT